jgi:hypothetical protein
METQQNAQVSLEAHKDSKWNLFYKKETKFIILGIIFLVFSFALSISGDREGVDDGCFYNGQRCVTFGEMYRITEDTYFFSFPFYKNAFSFPVSAGIPWYIIFLKFISPLFFFLSLWNFLTPATSSFIRSFSSEKFSIKDLFKPNRGLFFIVSCILSFFLGIELRFFTSNTISAGPLLLINFIIYFFAYPKNKKTEEKQKSKTKPLSIFLVIGLLFIFFIATGFYALLLIDLPFLFLSFFLAFLISTIFKGVAQHISKNLAIGILCLCLTLCILFPVLETMGVIYSEYEDVFSRWTKGDLVPVIDAIGNILYQDYEGGYVYEFLKNFDFVQIKNFSKSRFWEIYHSGVLADF